MKRDTYRQLRKYILRRNYLIGNIIKEKENQVNNFDDLKEEIFLSKKRK